MSAIDRLHDRARQAIKSGEGKLREAAEYLSKAKQLGASQRQAAKAIGKSPAWVNQLLKWRDGGYRDTPFGPQSKIKRASAVQAPKRPPTTEAQIAKWNAQQARAVACATMFAPETKRIPSGSRELLIKALQALGSGHPIERHRARLGLTWDELLVPAEVETAWAA